MLKKNHNQNTFHIFCTAGEPAGIGTEITLKAVAQILHAPQASQAINVFLENFFDIQFHILGDELLIKNCLKNFNLFDLESHPQITWHFHNTRQPIELGALNVENGLHGIELLNLAIEKISLLAKYPENLGYAETSAHLKFKNNIINAALVTAPIHKKIINDALEIGIKINVPNTIKSLKTFYGHTEYLAELAYHYGLSDEILPVLMLLNGFDHLKKRELRVALATVHVPLLKVSEKIIEKIKNGCNSRMAYDLCLIADALTRYFQMPHSQLKTIKVAGLNPHAGENGLLGSEEDDLINPFIQSMQQMMQPLNASLEGCFSGDTLMMQQSDCFYYMHHDQGLAPFKYVTFGEAANITLGLPFIRSSVDHGTALDLASFSAQRPSHESMHYAIMKAIEMLKSQHLFLNLK